MAISNIAKPVHKIVAAYNPIVFVADSTNKNATGFRYVFDIYSAGTSTVLFEAEIAPRITDGYGIFFAEEVIQNYVSHNFSSSTIPDSYFEFDVKVGETYGSSWNYDDYEFYSSGSSPYNAYTKLRQFASATTHTFSVGDQINVVQSDGGALKPMLSGLHTVVVVTSPYEIVIDIPFSDVGSGPSISGVTTYADNRKQITRNMYNYSAYTAINAAVPFLDVAFDQSVYEMSGTSGNKSFVTNAPTGMRCTTYQDMWFNVLNDNSTNAYYLYIQNDSNDVFRRTIVNSSEPIIQVAVGPNNVSGTLISGTTGIVKTTTNYYDVWVATSAGVQVSSKFRIYIDRRCSIEYNNENAVIAFLDRLGAFGSFAFQLKRMDKTKIKRDKYTQQAGGIVNGTWTFNAREGGTVIYNSEIERELTLNTNWMTEEESRYFDELVSSPVTFLYLDGQYQKVEVTDSNYETAYSRNKNLIKRTVTVALANNDIINA